MAAPFLLEFWDIELPDLTVLRLVSFADSDPTLSVGNPTTILFDGNNYTAIKLTRGDYVQSESQSSGSISLACQDPTGLVLGQIQTQSQTITNQKATLRIIDYESISNPAEAVSTKWRVINYAIQTNPLSVVINMGMPDFRNISSPRLRISRLRCLNDYSSRFIFGNFCTYPSDRFGPSSLQNFRWGGQLLVKHTMENGWFGINMQWANEWNLFNERNMICSLASGGPHSFLNAAYNSPNIYKVIPENASKTIDVYTAAAITGAQQFSAVMCGLFIATDTFEEPTYVFFGRYENTSPQDWILRSTVNGVTAADQVVTTGGSNDKVVRLRRVGSSFTAYTSPEPQAGTFPSPPTELTWTQRATVTNASFANVTSGDIRVGLMVGSDAALASQQDFKFGGGWDSDPVGLNFLEGGADSCSLTIQDCEAHRNVHDVNIFSFIPTIGRSPR